jgi:pimeloyl-ACP methyl ester carboxylesterase
MQWTPHSARSFSGTRCASGQHLPPAFGRRTAAGAALEYETVVDGRKLARPVNYALGAHRSARRRDGRSKAATVHHHRPRAGHGPGIGGFKDDSQVGVALRAGHPVYFVIFHRDPEPGQTLLDVCEAEKQFVRKVRELHPDSAKPAIIGNCQGGWAAMMLAAANPEDTGPIVINGAPMSYWGGAWQEGAGDNPMRYAGGNARRDVARIDDLGLGQRCVRRRVPGGELREPQPGEHILGQVLQRVRQHRHRAGALSGLRAVVGRASI